jgi:hypothetical protein
VTADSSFKVSGWIYRNYPNVSGKIYKIDHNFQAVSEFTDYYSMTEEKDADNSDTIVLSARPFVNRIDPYITLVGVSGNDFYIYGDMFHFLTAVYVSATDGVYPSAYEIDYFANSPKLSSIYPAFTGVSVDSFEILGEKVAKFTLPTPQTSGYVTVIPVNEAGYGNLVIDSIRKTTNPYLTSAPEYLTYVEPQFPWVSGIEVASVPV